MAPHEILRQDQWYHEEKQKLAEYGIRRLMNCQKTVTPEQKAALLETFVRWILMKHLVILLLVFCLM